jgi:hypothetical protein
MPRVTIAREWSWRTALEYYLTGHILFDGDASAIRLHLPTMPTLFEHAASGCGSARNGSDSTIRVPFARIRF